MLGPFGVASFGLADVLVAVRDADEARTEERRGVPDVMPGAVAVSVAVVPGNVPIETVGLAGGGREGAREPSFPKAVAFSAAEYRIGATGRGIGYPGGGKGVAVGSPRRSEPLPRPRNPRG